MVSYCSEEDCVAADDLAGTSSVCPVDLAIWRQWLLFRISVVPPISSTDCELSPIEPPSEFLTALSFLVRAAFMLEAGVEMRLARSLDRMAQGWSSSRQFVQPVATPVLVTSQRTLRILHRTHAWLARCRRGPLSTHSSCIADIN